MACFLREGRCLLPQTVCMPRYILKKKSKEKYIWFPYGVQDVISHVSIHSTDIAHKLGASKGSSKRLIFYSGLDETCRLQATCFVQHLAESTIFLSTPCLGIGHMNPNSLIKEISSLFTNLYDIIPIPGSFKYDFLVTFLYRVWKYVNWLLVYMMSGNMLIHVHQSDLLQ